MPTRSATEMRIWLNRNSVVKPRMLATMNRPVRAGFDYPSV
jgi:hypothetical protein